MIRSPHTDLDFFRPRNPPPPVAPQNVESCCIWDSVQSVEQPWPVSQAVGTKGGSKKKSPYTHGIEFLAVGTSKKGEKFLLIAKDDKHVVLSVRNLGRDPSAELERLEALDVHLLVPQARSAFLILAQEAARAEPTFNVATQIGWFDDVFVLPGRVYPPQPPMEGMPRGWSRMLVHLDAKDEDIHSRFYCHGSSKKSRELFQLCRGNSRFIFDAAHSVVGPCCLPFDLRAPGVQFVGPPGTAKTVLAVVAGATFGGVADSSLGFGSAWNGTPNGLEEYGIAHNDTLMVLDETSLLPNDQKGRPLAFGEAVMRVMQRQGKKRHGQSVDRWSVPFISTSNVSVYALLDHTRRANFQAYTDRLMDVPTPKARASFFENLHRRNDAAAFGKELFDLATTNFGHPSRVFLARLTSALAKDRAGLAAEVAKSVAKYEAAAAAITSPRRSVLRVRGHFATVYAVGCLAIQLKVLPFTEAELLAAILSCHQDHVAFVDNEVASGPIWSVDGAGAQVARGSAGKPIGGTVVPGLTAFERLKRFILDNRKTGFIDLRVPLAQRLTIAKPKGYIGRHGRSPEYWLTGARFEAIVGGKAEARDLKRELAKRGLMKTDRRGSGLSYVVKREADGFARTLVVAIRCPLQPKRPRGKGKVER